MEAVKLEGRRLSYDLLGKFGSRWAVLTAMGLELQRRGIRVSPEVTEQLKLARMEIVSGCFSTCEVGCLLSRVEGQLISIGAPLGPEHLRIWSDLLAAAMQGRIDLKAVGDIPALQPVESDCAFLACRCAA